MKSIAFSKFFSAMILMSLLTSCATMSDGDRTKAEGSGAGAIGGALLGGLLCKLTGGDDCEKKAIAGAVVGALAGAAVGSNVADKKAEQVSKEEELNSVIAYYAKTNQEFREYNTKLAQTLETQKFEVAALLKTNRNQKIDVAKLSEKKVSLDGIITSNNKILKEKNAELSKLKSYVQSLAKLDDGPKVAKLQEEIKSLQTTIALVNKTNSQFASLSNHISSRKS